MSVLRLIPLISFLTAVLFAAAPVTLYSAEPYSPGAPGVAAPERETIKKGELLNLARCVDIALKNQPKIISALNTVYANRSRVGQAESNYYPQVNLSSGYTKSSPVSTPTTHITGAGPFDQYTAGATLNQNIYDFGKTSSQVSINRLNTEAALSDLDDVSTRIIFSVKQAYYGVIQAKKNRDVADETVKQFEQHLEQAKGFYEVGRKPKFDVTKASTDLSSSRVNLIKAENALRIAIATLNNAMGVLDAPEYGVEEEIAFQKYEITFEEALKRAYNLRPDLKSAAAKRKSAGESITLSEKGYYPTLSGNAAYNWSGDKFPLEEGWNVGATVTFPLFSGFLTKYQVEESRASLNTFNANEELVRQTVFFDVKQAFLNLKEAEERVPAAEDAVKQAAENLEIANGRYAAGLGSPIEVTDAQVSYASARTTYIQALTDYKIAQASLEKAMGVR